MLPCAQGMDNVHGSYLNVHEQVHTDKYRPAMSTTKHTLYTFVTLKCKAISQLCLKKHLDSLKIYFEESWEGNHLSLQPLRINTTGQIPIPCTAD